MAASKFASALICDVYDTIFFGCSKADCQLDPNVSDGLGEGSSGQVSISGYYWLMPAAFCSFRNRNLFPSLILGLGVESMWRRRSQNTIKSLYVSQLLTFVFLLMQERLTTTGGCDSLVQSRVCFSFSRGAKDEGKRKKATFIETQRCAWNCVQCFWVGPHLIRNSRSVYCCGSRGSEKNIRSSVLYTL